MQFDIDELRLMAEAKPLSVLVFQCLTFVQDLERMCQEQYCHQIRMS